MSKETPDERRSEASGSPEQALEQATEQSPEQSPEQTLEQSLEQAPEQTLEQKPKKESLLKIDFVTLGLINMFVFFGFQMTNVGMPIYADSLGAGAFLVGLVTTLVTVASIIVRPFSGMILDRFNQKLIMIAAIAVMVAAAVGYAAFPIVGVILALRLFHGIGYSIGSTATSTLVANIIPKARFAEGMGYFAIIAALAAAVAPVLSTSLMENSKAMLMIALAIGGFVIGLILACIIKYQKPGKDAEKSEAKTLRGLKVTDLFDIRALLPSGTVALVSAGFGAVTTFVVLFGIEQEIENTFTFFVAYALSTVVCRPVIGKIVDKIGFFVPGIVATLGSAACLVMVSFSATMPMFLISGALAGVGFSAGMSAMQTMAVSAVPHENRGVAMSTYYLGWDGGVAVGSMLGGFIAGVYGYAAMFRVMVVFPVVGFIIFMIVGREKISKFSESKG